MLTFYNEHHAQHEGRFAILGGEAVACADTPGRLDAVLAELARRGLGRIVTPHGVPLVSLERIHAPRYLHFLRSAWSAWLALDARHGGRDILPWIWPRTVTRRGDATSFPEPDDFGARLGCYAGDSATPLTAGTWTAAKTGADCAVNAAHALRLGEPVTFALTRPPGQHAGADYFRGACFLNNAALAAQHLLDDGLQRVAILDLAHSHGSGTQDIFYERGDVLFVSIHADPHTSYPFYAGHAGETGAGAGLGCTLNLPLARDAGPVHWFAALETACLRLAAFAPQALVVSLGVDTAGAAQPFAQPSAPSSVSPPAGALPPGRIAPHFGLSGADFLRAGERLAYLGLPTVFVLEGGGAGAELGIAVVNVLEGFETAA